MYRLFLLFTALLLGASHPALAQDTLQPLIRLNPEYPVGARSQGIEGSVTVEFTVDAFGTIEDARVTASSPIGVFDQSALAAVQRWRYSADAGREATILSEQLNFSLTDIVWQLADNSSPATITPQNDCVRENVSYDYGEMVEAGLINTCTDPLLVFGCALGTAEYTGQWVCIDSERLKTVLLRPGDGRIGSHGFQTPNEIRDMEKPGVNRGCRSQHVHALHAIIRHHLEFAYIVTVWVHANVSTETDSDTCVQRGLETPAFVRDSVRLRIDALFPSTVL